MSQRKKSAAWLVALSVVGSVAAIAGLASLATAERGIAADATPTRSRVELAREQESLAKEALEYLAKLKVGGQLDAASPKFAIWSSRYVDALRKQGVDKARLIAALEDHVSLMKRTVDVTQRLYKESQGSHEAVLEAKYGLDDAESNLSEARGE